MPFTPAEEQRLKLALAQKSVLPRDCPECTQRKWKLWPEVVALPHTSFSGDTSGNQLDLTKPLVAVQLICENCGYVRTFSVAKLGYTPDAGVVV